MSIIGIDPGVNGGIAVVNTSTFNAHKMPDSERDLLDLLILMRESFKAHTAFLEDVQPGGLNRSRLEDGGDPQRRMGAKSAFSFGRGVGRLEMAVCAAGLRLERVRPQHWQKALGCRTGGDKNVSKRRAQELFGMHGLKITHAIADALLIAEYGRRVSAQRKDEEAGEPESYAPNGMGREEDEAMKTGGR